MKHKSMEKMHKNKQHSGRPRSQVPGRHHAPQQPARTHAVPRGEHVIVEGFLQLKGKFGFVLSEDPKAGDVMVQGPTLKLAMNGDRVRAKVTSGPEALRRSGEIVEVLSHSRQTVVGAFRRMGNLPVLVPEDDSAMVHLVDLQSFVPH